MADPLRAASGSFEEAPAATPRSSKRPRRRLYRWRVPCGYAVAAAAIALAHPTSRSLALGLLLTLPGAALRAWASGHLEKTRLLATGGPYRHTQHPLYLGSSILALGVAVASASPWAVLAAGAYLLAFFPFAMRDEQAFLRGKFGRAYEDWVAEVPRFVPLLRAAGPGTTRFRWGRVFRNGEWKTWLALPTVLALLYLWAESVDLSALFRG